MSDAAITDIVERLHELLQHAGPYMPLRIEEDWTWEITGAEGSIVAKLPYPKPYAGTFAALFVGAINALPELIERLRAQRSEPPADERIVKYILTCGRLGSLGGGPDPIGFLIEDHAALAQAAATTIPPLPPGRLEEEQATRVDDDATAPIATGNKQE